MSSIQISTNKIQGFFSPERKLYRIYYYECLLAHIIKKKTSWETTISSVSFQIKVVDFAQHNDYKKFLAILNGRLFIESNLFRSYFIN